MGVSLCGMGVYLGMGVGIVGMAGMDENGRDGMLGGMRRPRHVGMVRVGVGVPRENTHRSISELQELENTENFISDFYLIII